MEQPIFDEKSMLCYNILQLDTYSKEKEKQT